MLTTLTMAVVGFAWLWYSEVAVDQKLDRMMEKPSGGWLALGLGILLSLATFIVGAGLLFLATVRLLDVLF